MIIGKHSYLTPTRRWDQHNCGIVLCIEPQEVLYLWTNSLLQNQNLYELKFNDEYARTLDLCRSSQLFISTDHCWQPMRLMTWLKKWIKFSVSARRLYEASNIRNNSISMNEHDTWKILSLGRLSRIRLKRDSYITTSVNLHQKINSTRWNIKHAKVAAHATKYAARHIFNALVERGPNDFKFDLSSILSSNTHSNHWVP